MDYFLPRPKRVYLLLLFVVLLVAVLLNVVVFPSYLVQNTPKIEENRILCSVTGSLALSALERMKTEKCRQEVQELYCALENDKSLSAPIINRCPIFNISTKGAYEGCFADSASNRLLSGFMYKLSDTNSPEFCVDSCLRAGYEYAGVEFRHECFCGSSEDFAKRKELPQDLCQKYRCPQEGFCGGYEAMAVYRTGFTEKLTIPPPKYIEPIGTQADVRILFVIQLNGRDIRQFHRMLKTVYSPSHFYYVHIDTRQNFLFQEAIKLEKLLPNFKVTRNRRATIWGGASLLPMFLDSIRETKTFEWTEWDFVLNMSESDMMILTLVELEANLAQNKGRSYLSSHGYNPSRFIQKQGFNFVFFECEKRMWRIANRTQFPENMRLDGGSDWVIIGRELADFAISDESVVHQLLKFYETILLPLESFFHNLAMNTEFCHKTVKKNLRLTNWNRIQGCRHARVQKVVDWGGCSPMVFREPKIPSFRLEQAKSRAVYFARKFDAMIDIVPIAAAERQSMRNRLHLIKEDHSAFNSTWVNIYSAAGDADSTRNTVYRKFAALFLDSPVENIYAYKPGSTSSVQLVISSTDGEVLVAIEKEKPHIKEFLVDGRYQLVDAAVGLDLQLTEEVFREYTRLFDTQSTVTVLLHWTRNGSSEGNNTSPGTRVRWYPPTGKTVIDQKVAPYNSIFFAQHVSLDFAKYGGAPGEWKVVVFEDEAKKNPLVVVKFPVVDASAPFEEDLLRRYYSVVDRCSEHCREKTWSSRFSDPKSEIKQGFDSHTGWLQ
ncbi:hypothetical protein QR680_005893 [Steinernema hermaphroditum]|uniref:protein xylosyltransferase n=1 Tax=Steinernema hermaphroditum TaxID=289476 RepID=A0AA39LWH1_9BILA|nr:hypothetical protein QR680_005893 [Steinernema hermaphroditum]